MKTLVKLIVVLSLLLPSVTRAQVNFGIKAGLNFSNAAFDYADADPVLRVNAGIVSEINLGKNFLVKPELLYSAKGWKATDISVTLNYISLPLLAGCRVIPDLAVLLGPEVGYLTGVSRKPDADFGNAYEKFDYGIAVGASYRIVKKFSVELIYTHGFDTLVKAKLRDNNNSPTGEILRDGANRVIQLGLIYQFNPS
jgi:hypothetical protein